MQYKIEFELTNLMQELQKVSIELERVIEPYSSAIEEIIKKEEEATESLSKKSVEIQEKIKELTFLRAKSLKTGSGNITYVKGSIRRNWDLDGLDLICDIDEHVKNRIWNLRKEKEGEPQVRIKVELKGKSVINI